MPLAFVIMPFGEGFDEVYTFFIAETLTAAGYEVVRADNVRAQQNILKDIVLGLARSDLVVADLTDSNPNVFYELGIAHGLRRPVILLAQRIDEVPFDLRSYRVISYSTHFAEIRMARSRLLEAAREAMDGNIPFGSPVTDFLGSQPQVAPAPADSSEDGLLDHLVRLEDGFGVLTAIVGECGAETEKIGNLTSEATPRLERAMSTREVRIARTVVMELARHLAEYASRLNSGNDRYAATLNDTRVAFDFVVRAQASSPDEDLRHVLDSLSESERAAISGRASMTQLAETLRGLPHVERTFSRARDRAVREIERLVDNISQTVAMIARVREVAATRLSDGGSIAAGPNASDVLSK